MPIENILKPERLIAEKIKPFFLKNMVFTESNITDLSNKIFSEIDQDSDKKAATVIYTGYNPGEFNGGRDGGEQLITQTIQVSIVSPKEFYYENAGELFIQIKKLLNGKLIAPGIKIKQLSQDKFYNHKPEYTVDMVYLPMSFEVEFII